MEKIRVSINGFGRIGRAFFRVAHKRDEIEIVAVNDLGDLDNLAYLLKYDSAQGKSDAHIATHKSDGDDGIKKLIVDGKETIFLNQKDPAQLPWKDMNIDIAVESTGFFASYEKSRMHLDAGAKRVVISAPVKDEPGEGLAGATVLMGINHDKLEVCDISSNASCTTNSASPLIQILHEAIGIEKALLNTVHGYTSSQSLVDLTSKGGDFRKGRAAAVNIIPSTTGAAIAVTKAVPDLDNKFDGIALRVPVISGSIADITFIAKRETSIEEVNDTLRAAAVDSRWSNIFAVTEEQIVSSDIIGSRHASIADLGFTRVVGGNLVKVLAWYDNEMGYTNALVDHVIASGRHLKEKNGNEEKK